MGVYYAPSAVKSIRLRSFSFRAGFGAMARRSGETAMAGHYNLVAFAMLEDLAGNRIGRPFEVDQFDRADRSPEPEKTLIPFSVR